MRSQHLVGEVQRPRVHDAVDPQCPEVLALLGSAGGGEDLGPGAAGHLDGREADAAGRRMDQDALSRAEPAQVFQGVRRGEERDRQRRGLLEAEPGRLDRDQLGPRHDMTAEGEAGDRQHLVADAQLGDALTDSRDPAAALGTERHGAVGQAGIRPQRLHHVTEVEAGGDDLDLDLARPRRPPP